MLAYCEILHQDFSRIACNQYRRHAQVSPKGWLVRCRKSFSCARVALVVSAVHRPAHQLLLHHPTMTLVCSWAATLPENTVVATSRVVNDDDAKSASLDSHPDKLPERQLRVTTVTHTSQHAPPRDLMHHAQGHRAHRQSDTAPRRSPLPAEIPRYARKIRRHWTR